MTTEKLSVSNALASVSRSRSPDSHVKADTSADIFSRHLDKNFNRIDTGKPQKSEFQRTNDTNRANSKNLQQSQKNDDQAQSRLDEKQSRKEARLDARNERQVKTQLIKTEKHSHSAETKKTDNNSSEPKSTDKQAVQKNQADKDQAEKTNNSGNENTKTGQVTKNKDASKAVKQEADATTNLLADETSTQQDGQLPIIEATTGEDTEDTAIATSIEDTGILSTITTPPKQSAEQTTLKENNSISGTSTKTTPPLESTLGKNEDGSTSNGNDDKGQSSDKNPGQIAKTPPGTSSQNETGFQKNAQNQGENAPILANTSLSDINSKVQTLSQALKGAGPDMARLTSSDQGETLSPISTSLDAKSATPASQLRAAGYTSPSQSLAIQIAAKAQNGAKQFEIRLNPPELGRVDVRLEFTKDGQVNTHLIVERPETLELLSKDARQLERALSQAGVNIENEGLTFSLQDQNETNHQGQNGTDEFNQDNSQQVNNEDNSEQTDQTNIIYRQLTATNGLDISV